MINRELKGKNAIILGVANERSIAWGIAKALSEHGCNLGFSYLNKNLERRVKPLADSVNSSFVNELDINNEAQAKSFFEKVSNTFGHVDILIHSVAFADRADLENRFINTSRDGFALAMSTSVYSLVLTSRLVEPLMRDGGSIITLSYIGSRRVIPNYNVMGVCKAALESSVRYLAYDLGSKKINVNAISAGPIKTLSASGIKGFKSMLSSNVESVPLKKNINLDDLGCAALYLIKASSVTGHVLYVDSGAHIM